ncbi:MAG: transporter associated domain-containing protein [Gemmatimonadota bacterium]
MVPRVRVMGVPPGATPEALQSLLHRVPHTRYPVYDGTLDHIIGCLHVRDVLDIRDARQNVGRGHVRQVPFVPATARMDRVLAAMRQSRAQLAIIMDEHGGTAGIITMEDLFEEVIGDITERPGEMPQIVVEAPGRVRADGGARLEDIGHALGVVLEHDQVDTVSGLVLELLGRPPVVADAVIYDQVRFEVLALHDRGVRLCLAESIAPPVSRQV